MINLFKKTTGVPPIDELKRHYKTALKYKPIGATKKDVKQLEHQLSTTLPPDYRELLLLMGRDKNGILCGTNCFIDNVVGNAEGLSDLLRENDLSHQLPERYICPFLHQGYVATWFELPTEQDDPVAYHFNEGQQELGIRRVDSLVTFFLEQIIELTPTFHKIRENPPKMIERNGSKIYRWN